MNLKDTVNNSRFISYLSAHLGLDEELLGEFVSHCNVKKVNAGEILLHAGEISERSYFVEKGLLYKYGLTEEGKESILQFAPEDWFVADRESSFYGRPSLFYIQALEDTRAMVIDAGFLEQLTEKFPEFTDFNNQLLHNRIKQQNQRIYELLSATAEERYLSFVEMYPDILLRVPQKMVASYLGITPETLSRVRKELARKNFTAQR